MEKEIIGYKNNFELLKNLKKNPNNIKKFLPKKSWMLSNFIKRF